MTIQKSKMTPSEIAAMIDVSAVRADSTLDEVKAAAALAVRHDCICVFALPAHTPFLIDQLTDLLVDVVEGGRVAGAVGEKDPVGVDGQQLAGGRGRREHVDLAAPLGEAAQDPALDAEVVGADRELLVVDRRTGGAAELAKDLGVPIEGPHKEDEFLLHRKDFGYPDRIVDSARTAAAQLVGALERRNEPFDKAAAGWLQLLGTIGD